MLSSTSPATYLALAPLAGLGWMAAQGPMSGHSLAVALEQVSEERKMLGSVFLNHYPLNGK